MTEQDHGKKYVRRLAVIGIVWILLFILMLEEKAAAIKGMWALVGVFGIAYAIYSTCVLLFRK